MTSGNQMRLREQPLVSIVVPVYNNAEHFSRCLESILGQTYRNWDCSVVNNCSTDGSAEIANQYATRDSRVRLINNDKHLHVVANHNWALSHISADSKYCKVVFADDWIFPHCIEQMVLAGERSPSAVIIGAHWLIGADGEVKGSGLPYGTEPLSGRDIGRCYFLDHLDVFGALHNIMLRADVVRARVPFLNESNLHSDHETCLDLMQTGDFTFVHQILTFTRERAGSITSFASRMHSFTGTDLYEAVKYGRSFLDEEQYRRCVKERFDEYYNFLALTAMLGRRDSEFWEFHRRKLAACGLEFSRRQLARAALARIGRAVLHPRETLGKLPRKNRGMLHGMLPGT